MAPKAAMLLLLLSLALTAHAQYSSSGAYNAVPTQGATAGYPNTPTTATTASGGYPSSGITGGYPGTGSSGGSTAAGGSSSGYSTLGGSSSPLDTALQGAAGTGIGVAPSTGVVAAPGAGLTYTPSTSGRSGSNIYGTSGTNSGYGNTGYGSSSSTGATPVYGGSGTTSSGVTSGQSQTAGAASSGYPSGTSSQGTYAAQSRDPYSSSYSPTTVYIGGSSGAYTGATTAAAPRAGTFPPAAAPAPGPLVQLGPLGPAAAAAAQNTSFGETQFTGVGPIYKKQDSLGPFYANLYGIPVPLGQKDPDIFITLEVLGDATDVGLYCNPGWGQYADVNANYPQPGYAIWQSDLSNDVDTVFISKNDKLYRPPYAREPNTTAYNNYQPYFICSVINMDPQRQVAYRMEADLINNSGSLSSLEQRALTNIFNSCCVGSAAVCSDWKARNGREGGKLFTDWCNYPGQICTANGTLLRLDMRGYNLQCPFPATDLAVFTSLTTLNMGRNPNMTGSALDVFSALANAKSLRHLNLYRNSGLTGPLTPALSVTGGGLCQLARRSLSTLTVEGVGLTGGVPSCLLNNGSRLVELHLGNNNLTGSIPNVIALNSKLQVLTLYNNQLTGTIPSSIGNARQLSNFDITNNAIFGTIPASLGNITTLKYAILKFNKLTGGIPSALATNTNLETLDVKGNRLSVLPSEWINGYPSVVNSSLVNVRISFNNFSGPFPAALSSAPQLTFLVINNNTLSGPLPNGPIVTPTGFTNSSSSPPDFFPALRAMNISHNRFTGTLPSAFGRSGIFTLKPLQFADGEILMHVFDISYNNLSGRLPSFLDFTNVPEYAQRGIFIAGNNFTYTCNAQQSYINDICLPGSAPSPSQLPPLGTSTSGSRTAVGSLPRTNATLPAFNGTAPGQMVYPGGTYPSGGVSLPGDPSGRTTGNAQTANAQSAGQAVNIQSAPQSSGKQGLNGGQIAGIVIGVLLALALAAILAFLIVRRRKRVSGAPGAGSGAAKSVGGLGGLKIGGSNKFERFNDGLEMSESTRRMEGFGSGR
ncbi:g1564 [Coccomyxa elongata]